MEPTIFTFLLVTISVHVAGDEAVKAKPFAFASYFGDHMVLQQAPKKATIWGYAAKEGEEITVSISGKGQVNTTSFIGPIPSTPVWSVQLPAIDFLGPYNITAASSEGSINLTDVLFGDVWICSGQSNMQFTLSMAFNATKEAQDAVNYRYIRVFTVGEAGSAVGQYDLLNITQHWSVPSAATIGGPDWSYFSAVCWLYAKYVSTYLEWPIGLISSSYGGTRVEAWSAPNVLKKCGVSDVANVSDATDVSGLDPNAGSVLWNAMIRPFLNMTIYGVLWYQGEANAGSPTMNQYNCTFPAMIDDWRERFHQASLGQTYQVFPFGFVQLGPWRDNDTISTGFTDIRWHQTADYGFVPNARMKNTFMAVAMDLPDFTSPFTGIHPRDKQDVGHRLCTAALAVAYNQSEFTVNDGPFPQYFLVSQNQRTMEIDYGAAVDIRSTNGFEVTCRNISSSTEDLMWLPLPITSHGYASVTFNFSQICPQSENKVVSTIRYAWRESPCPFKQCAVYNINGGYPAPPFIQRILHGLPKVKIVK
ncbi:sialate O-acetylesterase-like [Haliotis asinina]|uniref:sialate O-acetylesterase-like n=1 Tax=Haliotis asinina TaxID=109174 RepID=UPI003531C572